MEGMNSYPNQDSPESERMHLKEWREWEWTSQGCDVARMRKTSQESDVAQMRSILKIDKIDHNFTLCNSA